MGNFYTNLETKVTNYGFNNALVEVYVYVKFATEIITPLNSKTIDFEYKTIIDAKMIEGEVPNFYDGIIEKNSNIISTSIS